METSETMNSILIKALGLEKASPEKQMEVVEAIGVVVYQAVITRAMEEMSDDKLDAFEKVTDAEPTPEILIDFFMQEIPNFETMMKEEATKIVADHVTVASQIGE
jgi:hypothetical protein